MVKKGVIIGGGILVGLLAVAGVAVATQKKKQVDALKVVRIVGAAPDYNLTVYYIAEDKTFYCTVGSYKSTPVGTWDGMIDEVWANKAQTMLNTWDISNVYDALLVMKMSYYNEVGLPYSDAQHAADWTLRNTRILASQPQPNTSPVYSVRNTSGISGTSIPGVGGASTRLTLGAPSQQFGCLSKPQEVDLLNTNANTYSSSRGWISKTFKTGWWSPIIRLTPRYNKEGTPGNIVPLIQLKLSKDSTPEKTLIEDHRVAVEIHGWRSITSKSIDAIMADVRKNEMIWNNKCAGMPGRERGCFPNVADGLNGIQALVIHAFDWSKPNV